MAEPKIDPTALMLPPTRYDIWMLLSAQMSANAALIRAVTALAQGDKSETLDRLDLAADAAELLNKRLENLVRRGEAND